jgi:hypothetical protein
MREAANYELRAASKHILVEPEFMGRSLFALSFRAARSRVRAARTSEESAFEFFPATEVRQ